VKTFFGKVGGMMLVGGLTFGFGSQGRAACITDLGPHKDNYGYAVFQFKNSCSERVWVSLCVKSYPSGSEAVYNPYGKYAEANSTASITDGMYSAYDSYRWNEGGTVSCPFYSFIERN